MIKFPCGICEKAVRNNHRAINCDKCKHWIHIKCNKIDTKTYEILKIDQSDWYCTNCLENELPFLKSNQLNNNSHSLTKSVSMQKTANDSFRNKFFYDSENQKTQHYFEIDELNKLLPVENSYEAYFHLNIGSISAHIDELKEFLYLSKVQFDVLCLTESKISMQKSYTANITIDGYNHESMPTESNKGGVLFYVKNSNKYKCRADLTFSSPKELESLFIEIDRSKSKNIIVGGVYKHPNYNTNELIVHLKNVFEVVKSENKELILMGDFNINLLDYEEKETVSNFADFIFQNSMQPHINAPTRITSHSHTLIDNIFSNFVNRNISSGNLALSISDHLPQFFLMLHDKVYKKETKNY